MINQGLFEIVRLKKGLDNRFAHLLPDDPKSYETTLRKVIPVIIDNNLDGSTLELSKNAFDCEKSALLQQERLTAYDNWVLDSYSTQSDYFPKSDDDRTFSRDLISGVEVEYEARSAESVRNTTEIAAAQQSCGFQGQTDYSKGSWHLENGLLINTETGEFRDANYDRIQDLYKRYALQETASNILGRHRVGFCMRGVGFNKSNVRIHRRDVENSNIKQANYKGLAHCANVRGCTVCAGLIGQHRAEEIRHGFDYAKDHNLTVQM